MTLCDQQLMDGPDLLQELERTLAKRLDAYAAKIAGYASQYITVNNLETWSEYDPATMATKLHGRAEYYIPVKARPIFIVTAEDELDGLYLLMQRTAIADGLPLSRQWLREQIKEKHEDQKS